MDPPLLFPLLALAPLPLLLAPPPPPSPPPLLLLDTEVEAEQTGWVPPLLDRLSMEELPLVLCWRRLEEELLLLLPALPATATGPLLGLLTGAGTTALVVLLTRRCCCCCCCCC